MTVVRILIVIIINVNQLTTSINKMNLIAFGLILICSNIWTVKAKFASKYDDNMMEGFLKKFKTVLKTGNEKLGIPVLDPFKADQLEIKLNEEIIKLDALLKKTNVNGLSEYDIIKADYTMSQIIVLNLHLSWPLIVANTNYSMTGKANDFEIYGKGDIKMSAENFSFDTKIDFILDGGLNGHLKIQDIKLKLSLKSLYFRITGLYNDDELSALLSAVISDMAPRIVEDDVITNEVIRFIKKPLDNFLSTKTLLELLALLTSV